MVSARRNMSVLVYADHNNAALNDSTRSCITAAKQLHNDVTVLVAGEGCAAVAAEAAAVEGVSKVLMVDNAAYGHHVAEDAASLMVALHAKTPFTHMVGSATASGRNIMPRVAAELDVQPVSDVIGIKDDATFVRPIYAGNALATVRSKDAVKVLTMRPTSFEAAANTGSAAVESADAGAANGNVAWKKDELSVSDRPELASAKVVVGGGRALGSKENFAILEEMADHMGGAVGASRAAVDAGYAVNDMQVGQTGKVVAPDLYVAVGISGAIQHLAGMKDSKTIVAINKDPEAAIFQVADYGLVADLFEAVPELNTKLKA